VKYPFFAQFLALCRARGITIPTIGLGSLHYIAPKPIVQIVIIRARHSAKIREKSQIVSEKTIPIIAHLCSEIAVFCRNTIRSFERSIRYSRTKHAFRILLQDSNYRPFGVSEWVVLLLIW
jgi:hypothetical protein